MCMGQDYSGVYVLGLGGDKQDSDKTTILFATINKHSGEIELVDYYEGSGKLRGHYFEVIKSKPYNYAGHYIPHDGKRSDTFSGEGMAETARRLHGVEMRYVPKADSVMNEIEVVRRTLAKVRMDVGKCGEFFEHITKYHESDTTGKPCHKNNCSVCKGASHGADAMRLLAMAVERKLVDPYLCNNRWDVVDRPMFIKDDWMII